METTPRQLISLVRFTTGRRIYVYRQVRAAAQSLNQPTLVDHIDTAIAHDRNVLDLETRWRTRTPFRRRHAPAAQQVDDRLDLAITALRDVPMSYVRATPVGDPMREAAERFIAEVFPDGVAPITSLPFVDQLAAVEHMLDVIASDVTVEVATLSLGYMVSVVTQLTDEYRTVLDRKTITVEFPDVQAARDIGQDNLSELIAMILGQFHKTRDRAHQQARASLLGPILAQQQAIRAYLRDRSPVPDVDPDGEPDAATGEPPEIAPPAELEPDTAPTPGTAPTPDTASA